MKRYFIFGESGQILPLTVILFVPMLFLSAFAIDLGSFYLRASELQTASDLAALAGAEALSRDDFEESDLQDLIEGILEANGFDVSDPSLQYNYDLVDGTGVRVDVSDQNVAQFFSQLITDEVQVDRTATATTGGCFDCVQGVLIAPPTASFPEIGDGDGYKNIYVNVDGQLRFYALNHHVGSTQGTNQLVCVDFNTRQRCNDGAGVGWPIRLETATSWEPELAVDEAQGNLYYSYQNRNGGSSTTYGIGCVTVRGQQCSGVSGSGFVQSGVWGRVQLRNGIAAQDVVAPQTDPVVHNGRVYSIDYRLNVYCLETSTNQPCAGVNGTQPDGAAAWSSARNDRYLDSTNNYRVDRSTIDSIQINERLYAAFHPRSGGSWIVCYDLDSNAPCSGFNPGRASGVVSSFFENVDASGGHDGVCYATWSNDLECLNRQGQNDSNEIPIGTLESEAKRLNLWDGSSAQAQNRFFRLLSGFYLEPLRVGDRLFVPGNTVTPNIDSRELIRCFDLDTGQLCPESGGTRQDLYRAYTLSEIGTTGCIGSLGHFNRPEFFDTNLADCDPGGPAGVRITPCACSTGEVEWGTLDLGGRAEEVFTSLFVTVLSDDGSDVLINREDIFANGNNGTIDLASEGITTEDHQSLRLQFDAEVSPGFVWDDAVDGQISVTNRATLID